jgi:hypothetical protein
MQDFGPANVNDFVQAMASRDKGVKSTDTTVHKAVYDLLNECKTSIDTNTQYTHSGVTQGKIAMEAVEKVIAGKNAEAEKIAAIEKKATDAKIAAGEMEESLKTAELKKIEDERLEALKNAKEKSAANVFSKDTIIESRDIEGKKYLYAGEIVTDNQNKAFDGKGAIFMTDATTLETKNFDGYSYAGEWSKNTKNGFGIEKGLEKLSTVSGSERHYYVGKFNFNQRAGGAYVIGVNKLYIGDFNNSTFNGYGCWRQLDKKLFGKFNGTATGEISTKIGFPQLYIHDNDIRYYDKDLNNFFIFEDDVNKKIVEAVNAIKLQDFYAEMSTFNRVLHELSNPLQSVWNHSTTHNITKTALGVAGLALVGAVGYGLHKFWNRKRSAKAEASVSASPSASDMKSSMANSSPAKSQKRKSKAELVAHAKSLGIEVLPKDTIASLNAKIAEKQSTSGSNRRHSLKKRKPKSKYSRSRR